MRGGDLLYYQKGDGLSYYQKGRGLGGILRNSLKKIQPGVQCASDTAVKTVAKRTLGAISNFLGVKNIKRK